MNIEPKLFVKYGIPGWYFSLSLLITLNSIDINLLEITGTGKGLLSSVILVVLGVPVGYILYQLYFFTILKDYKNDMPDWNVFVYSDVKVEDREYVNGRYAHMLRKIHEVGVLKITIYISVVIIYIPIFSMIQSWDTFAVKNNIILFYTLIQGVLLWVVHKNYKFKQEELNRYMEGIKESTKKANKKITEIISLK